LGGAGRGLATHSGYSIVGAYDAILDSRSAILKQFLGLQNDWRVTTINNAIGLLCTDSIASNLF